MMNLKAPLKAIEDFVNDFIAKYETVFLVDIKTSAANDITVFLDADDGITIQKCTLVNKALYNFIEETDLFPGGNFSLEVSSAGIDEPLKLFRQYVKNIERKIEVVTNEGAKIEGILTRATEEEITIEEKTGKGNKAIIKTSTILFNQIKHAIVLVAF